MAGSFPQIAIGQLGQRRDNYDKNIVNDSSEQEVGAERDSDMHDNSSVTKFQSTVSNRKKGKEKERGRERRESK